MKVFNPEKELRKIQYGNKNRVILFVVLLLVVSVISYSFALYQVRYSKQIIYTKVAPFNKKDIILSVKLDDQEKSTDKFPEKEEGYVYSHIECENNNIQNVNWNEGTWKLNADINGPDKCTVFFVKSPFHMKSCENKTMSECLLEEGQKFENILAFDDPDGNSRYIGSSETTNNYIWFNCDSYENLTNATAEDEEHNCERWRIIGSFKDITIVDEKVDTETPTKENLVKIIRAKAIGGVAWNIERVNSWDSASLQSYLNNEYLTDSDTGSWIVNNKDLNYNPITSFSKKNMIESVRWNIGAGPAPINIKAQQLYTAERNSLALWDGKIALMYPSDYGYATSGGTTSRSDCLNEYLGTWYNDPFQTECAQKDWLLDNSTSISHSWTLTPYCCNKGPVYAVYASGSVDSNSNIVTYNWLVRPSLYLKSSVKVVSGNGSSENPYVLSF